MSHIFVNSDMLLLLALLPVMFMLFVYAAYRRRQAVLRLFDAKQVKTLIDKSGTRKRMVTELFLMLAYVFMVLGLARPVWDTQPTVHPKTGRDLVFLLDVSQSMLAQDQPPSRLACAKNSIMQCLDELNTRRVGLVAFSGSTSIRCPLTRDFGFFRSALVELEPDSVAIGGTRIGDAISKTVKKVLTDEESDYQDLIMITDGESHSPINTNALSRLAEQNVRLIVIGLGSDTIPAEIPVMNEESGELEPLVYNGAVVRTRQESQRLKDIASQVPGSIYLNVGTSPLNMGDIYKNYVESTQDIATEQLVSERPVEQYWRFLLAAVACLAASILPRISHSNSFEYFGGRKHLILPLLVLLGLMNALPAQAASRSRLFDEGMSAYKVHDYQTALEKLSGAESKSHDPVITFNVGTVYYRLGDMENAISCFAQVIESASDKELSQLAAYNLGNSFFKMAFSTNSTSKQFALDNLNRSVAAYEFVVTNDPDNKDAVFNLDVARNALELMSNADDSNMDQQGEGEGDSSEEDEESEQGDAQEGDNTNANNDDSEEEDEQPPPNLTPDDIVEEEINNKLKRSRKTHADFGKVKQNW